MGIVCLALILLVHLTHNSPGQTLDSKQLVVGDVISLTSPPLEIVPADILVLSGDAIVNESMLTGESVPVSKMAARDNDLVRWRSGVGAGSDTAKNILYFGTRLVRIRKDGANDAVGLVLRTGFDTTKGALIRSMLFPKPMGFKFYRDSMRFIGVLAGIAGAGFVVSAGQFIRLGVCLSFCSLS
jgi:cation-transporting P-type ATPase 13A2